MSKADQRAETERLIRVARYGKRKLAVTRCAEHVREQARPRGGMLPGPAIDNIYHKPIEDIA